MHTFSTEFNLQNSMRNTIEVTLQLPINIIFISKLLYTLDMKAHYVRSNMVFQFLCHDGVDGPFFSDVSVLHCGICTDEEKKNNAVFAGD